MLRFRAVQPEDIAAICRFPDTAEALYFMFPKARFPLDPAVLAEAIAARFSPTVALRGDAESGVGDADGVDGTICGFANFHARDADGTCAIGNVIVDPKARGMGVAKRLIAEMIAVAATRYNAPRVRAACFNANAAGLLLYAGLGFTPYAIEQRKDPMGGRVALIHMARAIETGESQG